MKDTPDQVPVPLVLMFTRHERPRALNISVIPASSVDLDDLVRFQLACRPLIRDLVTHRLIILWELLRPNGACLVLREQEDYESIEQLARNEIHFVTDELERFRNQARTRLYIECRRDLASDPEGRPA